MRLASSVTIMTTIMLIGCPVPTEVEIADESGETIEQVVPKNYALTPEQIKPLAVGFGAGLATDMIVVDGRRVAFMYREQPDNDVDSGWRFMSGYESDQYMEDPNNAGVYDLNTIANYDPEIVPFLEGPIGSAFERIDGKGKFVAVKFDPPE